MKKHFLFIMVLVLSLGTSAQDFEELLLVTASDRGEEDRFGWSVDIDGDFAIVGAYADDYGDANPNMGSAYIYQLIAGVWTEVQKLSNSDQDDYDRFGWSVAIDGDIVVVGAYGEDHDADDGASLSKAGSAYIFERGDDGVWDEVQKVVASDRAADDEFGWSVAVHGTTAIIGAHNDDKDEFGMGFFYHAGSAYIFDRGDDGTWSETQKIVASDRSPGFEYDPDHEDWNDRFGESVAIWNDYIVVGGPFASKAYTFERVGATWTEVAFLTYPGISWLDRAAPVSIDSTTIVLGAPTEDLNADGEESILNSGGAMIYKRTGGTWSYFQKISPSDRDAGDHFGNSVSIDGDYVIVGTHSDNHDEFGGDEMENTGSVFVFEIQDDGTFDEVIKLDASDRWIDDEFGIAVSISGINIIVGAFQQDQPADGDEYLEDAGGAYFFSTEEDGGGGDPDCDPVYLTQEADICSGTTFEVGDNVYDETGIYLDTLATVEGCDSIVTTILNVDDPIEYDQDFFVCFGESIEVGGSIYDETGFYINEFTTDEGCDSVVTTFLEVADEVNTDISVDGLELEADEDGVSYQWMRCEPFEIIDGATSQVYLAEENGLYAVIITDGECSDTSDCAEINSIGITEDNFAYSVAVYPNPSNGQFIISGESLVGTQIQVFNTIGELIFENTANSNQLNIDLTGQSTGIYMLRITGESGIKTVKLIVE